MTDPYRVGLDVLSQTGSGLDERRNRAAEVAPDFMRLALAFTYGEIFARPGLDLKLREFAAVAAFAALGRSPSQLRQHVEAALHVGWTKAEIIEILVQTATHAGVATAIDAMADCHDLLIERDPSSACCESR